MFGKIIFYTVFPSVAIGFTWFSCSERFMSYPNSLVAALIMLFIGLGASFCSDRMPKANKSEGKRPESDS